MIHYSPGDTAATREVHGGPVEGEFTSNPTFVTCRTCRFYFLGPWDEGPFEAATDASKGEA